MQYNAPMNLSYFFKLCCLALLGILSITASSAFASTPDDEICWQGETGTIYNCDVRISPDLPNDQQSVSVAFAGEFSSSCLPQIESIDAQGDQVVLRLSHDVPSEISCLTVIEAFEFEEGIGVLNPGSYQLQVYVNSELVWLEAFSVQPTRSTVYLPLILQTN